MNDSEQSQIMEAPAATPPNHIALAVAELSNRSGHQFSVTNVPVEGTKLYVVYATDHPFSTDYTIESGVFGFRVPENFPDASPEDSFFIQPVDVKLKSPDTVRNSSDIHRATVTDNILKGTELENKPVLLFSWHLWDRSPWDRAKHTLVDHYTHCLRRFESVEHDLS